MSLFLKIQKHLCIPESEQQRVQAQRLFHGRGHAYDGLKHIAVDWLPPVVLITLFSPEEQSELEKLSNYLLSEIPPCKSIQLQHRYTLSGPIETLKGEPISNLVIQENISKYKITLGKARNTGLFLDMKNGRRWVQDNAKNKRVLNLFAYTCGFSVTAIEGGATSVLNVDMSSAALSIGRENHRLNDHSLQNIRFEKLNIFKSFGRLKKRGPFDLLICDPPTLQKGSVDIKRDYPKIMRRLNEFMASEASLLLCLNAPELNIEFLIENMLKYAPDYIFIEIIKPPESFQEAQSKGLKILYFKKSC